MTHQRSGGAKYRTSLNAGIENHYCGSMPQLRSAPRARSARTCRGLLALSGMAFLTILVPGSPAQAQSRTESHTYDQLGRLIKTQTNGGPTSSDTRSFCYDEEGNRKRLEMTTNGTVAACAPPPAQTPPPPGTTAPPPPPPPSSNTPPVAMNDTVSGQCFLAVTKNVTSNDSDAEDNPTKPILVSVASGTGGQAGASKASDSSISVAFGPAGDLTRFIYTIRDSAGATATGQLTVSTSTCGGVQP